jgi:phage regulatory protein, rha family
VKELVVLRNRRAVTTSTNIAESFEKRHDNVLRDIQDLRKDVLNFEEMFREGTEPDSYGRPHKVFYMNRDGFTILAMGFTGHKAIQFKLKYIDAFNKMEEQLSKTKAIERFNIPKTYPDALRLAANIQEQKEAERIAKEKAQHQLKIQAPVIDYYDHIMQSPSTVTTTQIAQDYGLTAYRLNKILSEEGVQYKVGGQWILYSKYKDKKYVDSYTLPIIHRDGHESVRMNTKWTQRGRKFIHETLKKRNIHPQVFRFQESVAE